MTKKEHHENLSHIWFLKEWAKKLRKEADGLEVIPRGRTVGKITQSLDYIGRELSTDLFVEMPESEKKKWLRVHRYSLASIVSALRSAYLGVEKYPELWEEIRGSIKQCEDGLNESQKRALIYFQKR